MLNSCTLEKFGKTFLHNVFVKSTGLKVFSVRNLKIMYLGNSLEINKLCIYGIPWWSGLAAFIAEGLGSIAGRKAKTPEAAWYDQGRFVGFLELWR